MTRNSLKTKNTVIREFLAETLGTFILVCIGLSVNASVVLSGTESATLITCIGWGLAVAAAIYVSGGVSGGHVNPAVTLAFAIAGKIKWRKVPHYFAAQYFGAFLGTFMSYCVYIDTIKRKFGNDLKIGGENGTAAIFVTFPNQNSAIDTCLVDQIVSSALLLLIVNAVIDKKNMQCPNGLIPIAIGLMLTTILFAFEFNCGAPLNPARDVAPRLFTWLAGWGKEVFAVPKFDYRYFWLPIFAPHLGAIIGTAIYVLVVENHLDTSLESI